MIDPRALDSSAQQRRQMLEALVSAPRRTVNDQFQALAADAGFELPAPGAGRTLQRWQALADVASHDLSLVKLYEGHADALAILAELNAPSDRGSSPRWAVWASESPLSRVLISSTAEPHVTLQGTKQWCSGAECVTDALVTCWSDDGSGPYLVRVEMAQPGIAFTKDAWQAVGMADSGSLDIHFDGARGQVIGSRGDYVNRPGFMHGGAGIAACWFGGSVSLAQHLRQAVAGAGESARSPFRSAALGKVDIALGQTAAVLREAAAWIDNHPRRDASVMALRARLSAEACARTTLDEVGRALGAGPFCRDAAFARMAADLPVFTRQSLAERDYLALGDKLAHSSDRPWQLESA